MMDLQKDEADHPVKLPASLEAARIPGLPPSAYYIPNFITPGEEERLLQKIQTVPVPRWTQLSHRRLQTWPSSLTKSNTLISSPLPDWLTSPVLSRFESLGIFSTTPHHQTNHVLINEYHPNQGIMPHEDGSAYAPIVATVSLGADIVLDVYAKKDDGERESEPRWRVLQERRSLLVSTQGMYRDVLHGIKETAVDEGLGEETVVNWELLGDKGVFEKERRNRRGLRISLTYRDVLKVAKVGRSLKFFNK